MKKQTVKKQVPAKTKKSKSAKKPSRNWRVIGEFYAAIPLAILIVLFAGYLARGWIRFHAEPKFYYWSTDRSKQALKNESKSLGSPLGSMGFTDINQSGNCTLVYANGLHSQIYCGTQYQSYISDVRGLKPSLADRSSALDKTLVANGWATGNTTLSELGKNISQGIDYTPDATYTKHDGRYECMISFTTAFSKPNPPAINAVMSCSRVYELLGSTPARY